MRIFIVGAIALIVGASLGLIVTRMELNKSEERFELAANASSEADFDESRGHVNFVNGIEKDFGLVPFDSKHPHSFVIRNDGDEPLKVDQVTVSCSACVDTDFQSELVQPGAEMKIDVVFTARKAGPALDETLDLRTSDPTNRYITCHLKAFVGATARFDVESLILGDISATDGAEATCMIYGYYSDEMELLNPHIMRESKRDYIDFELTKVDVESLPDKDEYLQAAYKVKIQIKPGIAIGSLKQGFSVLAKVDGREDKLLQLPIKGTVAGDISLLGPKEFSKEFNFLRLGRTEKGKEYLLHVLVKGPHRHDVKLSIESTDPAQSLTATLGEPVTGKKTIRHPLTVTIPKDSPSISRLGTGQAKPGKIVIKTTHPTSKDLTLLVTFAID